MHHGGNEHTYPSNQVTMQARQQQWKRTVTPSQQRQQASALSPQQTQADGSRRASR